MKLNTGTGAQVDEHKPHLRSLVFVGAEGCLGMNRGASIQGGRNRIGKRTAQRKEKRPLPLALGAGGGGM